MRQIRISVLREGAFDRDFARLWLRAPTSEKLQMLACIRTFLGQIRSNSGTVQHMGPVQRWDNGRFGLIFREGPFARAKWWRRIMSWLFADEQSRTYNFLASSVFRAAA